MKMKSSAFESNKEIPSIYSALEDNMNPPLEFLEVPDNTESLTLIMDDPDAPGGTFTHWLMWNIPSNTREILEGDWPEGAEQGLNGAGELGYSGPNPPSGTHHYHFKVYALNKKLSVSSNITPQELEREVNEATIEKAELVGLYTSEI